MATVVGRTFRSIPHRNASLTWDSIVNLLTQGKQNDNREELMAVAGIAASLIADQNPKDAPIIITCEGTRTRIYCTYDEDAIDGADSNEDSLAYDPLKGEWRVSLPCHSDDVDWVSNALKKHSSRIEARDTKNGFKESEEQSATASNALILDMKGFLGHD